MRGTSRGQLAGLAAIALAVAAAGCTEERKLSAGEFVADVNEQGVELTLGEPLHTEDESKELYAVTLEPVEAGEPAGHEGEHGGAAEPGRDEGHGHEHGGGSLAVYEGNGAAGEGLKACESAADLLCYRAANIVVILEEGGIEAQRLGVAIEKLAEE
jgi:hypothetical protein